MDIFYEKALYRILQGRLRLPHHDPVFYIYEPCREIIEASFEIYDQAYQSAYFKGVYIKQELKEVLFNNELWSPDDDKQAEKIEKQIEELKLEAYKSYFKPKELSGIKANIRHFEKLYSKFKSKFHILDHTSCEGVASFSRMLWIVSQTTKDDNGNLYDYEKFTLSQLLDYYNNNSIEQKTIRHIARSEPFRSMWNIAKKQSNVFGRAATDLTKDQLSLTNYSSMYDNVYESSDKPDDEVIKDDDCLDGWFINQDREFKKNKKQREVDSLLSNKKIANSDEIFIMAKDQETASKIYDINDPHSRNIIRARNEQIQKEGHLNFTKLHDVRQDINMQAVQSSIKASKRK